ncbi:MAG: hypothetical protein JWQ09_3199, partial [Segetibacter sp.]|nr:hypothetical protein [Segetibacter sp.]
AEATVVHCLIKAKRKERAVIVPFLIFLWLLSFHQGKESDKKLSMDLMINF